MNHPNTMLDKTLVEISRIKCVHVLLTDVNMSMARCALHCLITPSALKCILLLFNRGIFTIAYSTRD